MNSPVERHEQAVAAAAAQAGVLALRQLTQQLGWTPEHVKSQLRSKRWQRVHRGIYAVHTGELPLKARLWAAHLRCGDNSVLAGRTALHVWGLVPHSEPIELLIGETMSNRKDGFVVTRTSVMPPTQEPPGLPPTVTCEYALLAVISTMRPIDAVDLASRALQSRRASPTRLARAMESRRISHRKLLTELLHEHVEGSTTPLEVHGTRRVLKAHGLPLGQAQASENVNGRTVVRDRVIGNLIIEFDGRLGHADTRGRLRDHARDNAAMLTGRPTLRFGWQDVMDQACESADQVAILLTRLSGNRIEMRPCSRGCRSQLAIPESQIFLD